MKASSVVGHAAKVIDGMGCAISFVNHCCFAARFNSISTDKNSPSNDLCRTLFGIVKAV